MDIFLGKLTQHAMNYAIRSGIAITSSYAIRECSRLLKTVDDSSEYLELQALQQRLDSKIRIISPAIDMIELISARGNTTLESAVSLTKALRWDIQALATRLSKAASAEEISRRNNNRASTRAQHKVELRSIVGDIRKLLQRIEDAVPLINLAITTSGASLTTSLPATVSPSRLLQASTFLTAGDTQFSMDPNNSVQVGPSFMLSVYMLFAGHAHRTHLDKEAVRDTTWKEVVHKARVKLIRIPLSTYGRTKCTTSGIGLADDALAEDTVLAGEGKANEFAYQLEIIEDLDDDRMHSFEDDERSPGPYMDVLVAGIREVVPIHEISKIFYADTGKILNICNDGEPNSPVLLLKRDVNALPPRRMMGHSEYDQTGHRRFDEEENKENGSSGIREDNGQSDIDHQILRESSVAPNREPDTATATEELRWRFPPGLDPEWLAFEVYTENENDSSDEEQEAADDSAYVSRLPISAKGKPSSDSTLISDLAQLHIKSPSPSTTSTPRSQQISTPSAKALLPNPTISNPPFGLIRSSLSLLEMLIRLTALQQFQQASHLSIPDELLTFFLEESSTTGAGGNGDERRRKRHEARQKVGFDPYDESPVKRRGEEYQYSHQNREQEDWAQSSREGTPYSIRDYDSQAEAEWYHNSPDPNRPMPSRERITTPGTHTSPEPWLSSRSRDLPPSSYSPQSPYIPSRRAATRPLDRVQLQALQARGDLKLGSPLGRGVGASVDTDSSLGTSPGTPSVSSLGRARGQGHGKVD